MMSPILTLLTTSAVPFQYPADYPTQQRQHMSLAQRRRQRGSTCSTVPQTLELQNTGMAVHLGSNQNQLDADNQRALMAAVLNEAVKTIEYVIGPEDVQVTNRENEQTSRSNVPINPRPPPNSPSYEQSQTSFEFPVELSSDGECTQLLTQQCQLESQDFGSVNRLRRTRSMRKRRRKSSFKDPTIQPIVVPKLPQIQHTSTSSNEADDEGSEEEAGLDHRKKTMTRTPSKHCHKIFSYHHRLNDKGLEFGLELVAETQKLSSSSSSEDTPDNGRQTKMTDWSKVGEELRSIADSFQASSNSNSDGTNLRVEATLTGIVPLDILSIINMMLPVSIPQSLWSALVSYAAWKIFKRLQ